MVVRELQSKCFDSRRVDIFYSPAERDTTMFYDAAWDNNEEVDDWETDTDAINTENIRSGKSAAEALGTITNAAAAQQVRQ